MTRQEISNRLVAVEKELRALADEVIDDHEDLALHPINVANFTTFTDRAIGQIGELHQINQHG